MFNPEHYLDIKSDFFYGADIISRQIEIDVCHEYSAGNNILKIDKNKLNMSFVKEKSVDTLIALDIMTKVEDWANFLGEASRKVCLNGNIIANFYSLDHWKLFDNQSIKNENNCVFGNLVSLEKIIEKSEQFGLSVLAVIPYGFADTSTRYRYPFNNREVLTETGAWQRHFSWLPVEEKLSNFCLFIEKQFICHLPTTATGRYLVIFRKSPGTVNHCYSTHISNIDINTSKFALDLLTNILPNSEEDWKAQMNSYLDNMRCSVIFFFFWSSLWRNPENFGYSSFLEEKHIKRFELWWEQESIDQNLMAVVRQWCLQEEIAQVLTIDKVNLGSCMEYNLIPNILNKYYKNFGV